MDCLNCDAKCCREFKIPLETIDIAKIIYYFDKKGFSSDWFGNYLISNYNVVIAYDKYFGQVLSAPCPFLNDNLCDLHYEVVSDSSVFGSNLKGLGVDLNVKPLVCRLHPYFFDKGGFARWDNCFETIGSINEEPVGIDLNCVKNAFLFEAKVKSVLKGNKGVIKGLLSGQLKDFLNGKMVIN